VKTRVPVVELLSTTGVPPATSGINPCHWPHNDQIPVCELKEMAVCRPDAGYVWRRRRDAGGGATLNHRLIECDPSRVENQSRTTHKAQTQAQYLIPGRA